MRKENERDRKRCFALTVDLPEDRVHLAMLRHVVREGLTSLRVHPQDVDDIEVLVGELATNALQHARSTKGYRVEVVLHRSADSDAANDRAVCAVILITDHGTGFARAYVPASGTIRRVQGNSAAPGESDNGEEERWGGWGLPLVEKMADEVQFEPNKPYGTRVCAVKRLRE